MTNIKKTFAFFKFCVILMISCTFGLCTKVNASAHENIQVFLNPQDRPISGMHNPIKDLSKFNFYVKCPAKTEDMYIKVSEIIGKELEQIGKFQAESFIQITDEGILFNKGLAGFNSMTFEIQDLRDREGQKLGIIRASLNISAHVKVIKTDNDCSPYIWTSNYFMKGSTKKDLGKLVSESFKKLLADFMSEYSSVNSEKLLFNLEKMY